ncbi:hypothetical protein, partial [Comamonas testosteroni]|uniref:hypothetical protein n=1 Tax=Comamonas testosteroni TaxID=285 RepID=UPI001EE88CFE
MNGSDQPQADVQKSAVVDCSWLKAQVWPSAALQPLKTATRPQFPVWPSAATSNLRLFKDLEGIVALNVQ